MIVFQEYSPESIEFDVGSTWQRANKFDACIMRKVFEAGSPILAWKTGRMWDVQVTVRRLRGKQNDPRVRRPLEFVDERTLRTSEFSVILFLCAAAVP
jgi:hypothetical protein